MRSGGDDGAGESGDAAPSPTSGRAVADHVRENDEHLDRVRSLIAEVDDLLERNLGMPSGDEEATGPARGDGIDDVPSSLDLSDGGSPPPVPDGADGSDGDAIEIEFGSVGGSTVSDLASSPSASRGDTSDDSSDEEHGREWAGRGIGIDAYPDAGPMRVEVDLDAPRLGGAGLDELRGRLGAWRSESAGELDRWQSVSFGELFQRRSEPAGLDAEEIDADGVRDRLHRWNSDLEEGSRSPAVGSPRSHATSATDVSDDIHVTPERTRGLAAELERVDSAYEAERSMEEAALMLDGLHAAPSSVVDGDGSDATTLRSSDYEGTSETNDGSGRKASWIPEEGGSTATMRRGDDGGIDAIVGAVVSPTASPEGPSVARGESASPTEGASGDKEGGPAGSGGEALFLVGAAAAAAAAAADSPGSDQAAAEVRGEGSAATEGSYIGEVSGGGSVREESTVSDLASSVATPLGESDDWERSQVWTGHGISIDLDGVDVSDESESTRRGESSLESAENLAGDERGPAGPGVATARPPSMPSAESPAATDGRACQPFQRRHTTGSTASAPGGSQRKKVGEIRFGRPTRISLDDIHGASEGAVRRQRSFPPSRSGGTAVRSVLIYPPVVVDDDGEDGIRPGDGDRADDKSPTLEWARRNVARGGSPVEYVWRDSPPELATPDAGDADGSGRAFDGSDEEMGGTTAMEVRSRRGDYEDGGTVFATASNRAHGRKGRRRRRGCVLALLLVAAVSASLAGAMLSGRPSGGTDAVAAVESAASPSPSASRAPATAASGVLTSKPSLAADTVLTSAPIINPTISPTATPTINTTTVGTPSMAPSAGAPGAIESTASPSLAASRAPATTASEVFTAEPSPTAVVLTAAPISNPTISPTATPTIQSKTVEPSGAPSTGAPEATESAASPSPSASRAPTTTASEVFTAEPSPAAVAAPTSEPIVNPTISPTATPTVQSTTVEPPSMAPSTGSPETNGPTADQACQLVTIRVEYGNATIIGWTLVETGDNELLFDEGTYVDSFYSSDPDVAGQPQVTEDCLKSGSYRWFTYGDGEGSYSLDTPSSTLVEGTVEFHGIVAFVIPVAHR